MTAFALVCALLAPPADPADEWRKETAAGLEAFGKGKVADAEAAFARAAALAGTLYPPADFPDGHEHLATSHTHLGHALAARGKYADAEKEFRRAVAVHRKLRPNEDGEDLPAALSHVGHMLHLQGKFDLADPVDREVLALYRRLHPKDDHPNTAMALSNLGVALFTRGKAADAVPLLEEALGMRGRLFKDADHPLLAQTHTHLGQAVLAAGKPADAEKSFRAAADMWGRLAGGRDHPAAARAVSDLAGVLEIRGQLDDAEPLHRQALDVRKRLFPKQDHPDVAVSLNAVAHLLIAQGKPADAEPLLTECLDMRRRLFPTGDHPQVAATLGDLAYVHRRQGRAADAEPLLVEALGVVRRLTVAAAGRMADGEAVEAAGRVPLFRDAYLGVAAELKREPAAVYARAWADKGAVSRVYERRQLQARAAAADPKAAKLLAEMADARRRRAELLVAPAVRDEATRRQRDDELKGLEKLLAEHGEAVRPLLPAVGRIERLNKATPADLQAALPADAVVIDFLRWTHFEFDPKKPGQDGEKRTPKYLAFVVTRDGIKWLDLGPADRIEKAVGLWREAITDGQNSVPADLGAKVRELVWEPARKALPKGVKEVYLSPDAALCRLPWVALPGDEPGTLLVEDAVAVAVIPHAPFLLDHLWERDKGVKEKAGTLVVGGVDFDAKPGAKPDPTAPPDLLRDAKARPWQPLAGTQAEADGLLQLAKDRKRAATSLTAADATPAAVLKALPSAGHAHFATHGFFADGKFRSAFQLDEKEYQASLRGGRVGRAANSPLVMTGLVLAGANDPATPGRGIVTGESLVDLDLSGLELAVLSACETGLGEVAGGEGVFGLQRAFHTAGTRNVVASLWSVSDAATAALMGEFYRQLWEKGLSPVQALKQAQLKVLKTDRKVLGTLRLRGPEGSGVKDTVEANFPPSKGDTTRNHPALWAAFTLSGPGK